MRVVYLLAVVVGAIYSYFHWQKKQSDAKVRLRQLDEGERCIACDGTEMAREGAVARCLRCGHKASLEALRAAKISASEIADVTKPDERRQ